MSASEPPVTGNAVIDEALAAVAASAAADIAERARQLADAQATLAEVLRSSREDVPPSTN